MALALGAFIITIQRTIQEINNWSGLTLRSSGLRQNAGEVRGVFQASYRIKPIFMLPLFTALVVVLASVPDLS